MAASETIYQGAWIDYSPIGGPSFGGGGSVTAGAVPLLETTLGKKLSVLNYNSGNWMSGGSYNTFNPRITNLNILVNAGYMPMTPWCNWDQTTPANDFSLRLAAITAGNHDPYITQFATDAKTWGGPLLLRFAWEQNLSGLFPWQHGPTGTLSQTWGGNTWTNTTLDYVNAFQHIVNIFKYQVGCFNVRFVWCPNIRSTSDTVTYAQMYPGSAFVDWLGFDGYAYWPSMTMGQVFRGTPNFPAGTPENPAGGGGTGLQDSYAQMIALDPVLPVMIGETGINGVGGSPLKAITSITSSGATWTFTVAAEDANFPWAANQGISVAGASPAGYNGEWTITSRTSATVFVATGSGALGAAGAAGNVQLVQRIQRAATYKQSLEIDLPAMPRIKALTWFWTAYNASQWTPDWDGSQPNNFDAVALRAAMNAHYLAGKQLGTSTATRVWIPFQDQPMPGGIAGAMERYRAVLKSVPGCVGIWLLNDSAGPVADDSGNGRTGAINGTVTLSSANVIPAEPTWTSASFPGSVGNNITVANNAAFSPATTGKFSIVTSWYLPSAPTARSIIVSKYLTGNLELQVWVSATQYGCTLYNIGGGTYADYPHGLPATGVPHHTVFTVDTTATTAPLVGYLDANAAIASGAASGVLTAGTAAVIFGQTADGTLPLTPAGARIGPTAIYNTTLSAESVAELYAAWNAAPVISAVLAS